MNLGVKNVHALLDGYQAWISNGGSPVVGSEPGSLPSTRPAKPSPPAKPVAPAKPKAAPPRP